MMVEESEIPGRGGEGRGRGGEPDFLAERRARMAAESGEAALQRRAEAAEATVQTLERHVESLKQRLAEAEEERRRTGELLDSEREQSLARESELRRVKQREYAEQQLRVEAEGRLLGADRDYREDAERLAQRLGEGEQRARELAARIEALQRQLAEAEQAAAAERSALRRSEAELHARVAELERRAAVIEEGLQQERGARERAERELAGIREAHGRMQGLLGDVRGIVGRLGTVIAERRSEPSAPAVLREVQQPEPATAPNLQQPEPATAPNLAAERGLEMADALAAAVERLRARAQSAPPPAMPDETAGDSGAEEPRAPTPPQSPGPSQVIPQEARENPADAPASVPGSPASAVEQAVGAPSHKHSRSLVGRLRDRRKQRRAR